ncbi:hypothetical protein JCM9140_1215 [Halalkalibacter wakoensis JCM 9140]|uniref:Uncharacterized protein n=1 Tax=Halalkalibacter wakoensis JCM 9140 TaxID=1236970 RepID=W4Q0I1_9BACI|nr:hypothetical protein [Halalkalibacter wakoensis]GAE25233.1 hypothetical protein JCM9140_1215 [Halalkalibacter wakoensis JCM 9140]
MAKKSIIASVATAACATTVLAGNKRVRTKLQRMYRRMYTKWIRDPKKESNEQHLKIGHSHPHDYEDNKMVGEGALTSIQHYNDQQQKSHR